ncbi:MAG: type II toxin-antitoxin system VapC family toxin [Candidatus Levybacteria bacterium]|nr:type II toxin-antitoxin system VapC family toxin [Candidatus Levybacteria bacterium]
MNNSEIIIDSSVILKWLFQDETHITPALRIKKHFESKKVLISIPYLFFYEVSNVLKNGIKKGRINMKIADKFYESLLQLELRAYTSKELLREAFNKAIALDISSYDASYIVLAEYLKIPFYTADEKLLQKAKGKYLYHLNKYPLK